MNDEQIRRKIQYKLAFELNIFVPGIGVSVENRVVTLFGTADTLEERTLVERAALKTEGVRILNNQIQVPAYCYTTRTEADLMMVASQVLKKNPDVPETKILVLVDKNSITLSGEVDWQYEKEAAYKAIMKIKGIRNVYNKITVKANIYSSRAKPQELFQILYPVRYKNIHPGGSKIFLKCLLSSFPEVVRHTSLPGFPACLN